MSSSSSKFVYGNWKMSQSLSSLTEFVKSWKAVSGLEVGLFPSYPHLSKLLVEMQKIDPQLKIGAQDCSTEAEGAFTGEVSANQIRELGATHILIGHSERRQRVPETPVSLKSKLQSALSAQLIPVFCIGENEKERAEGETYRILENQLKVIEGFEAQLILAYEPVWAIGTGKVAQPKDVEEAHAFIWKKAPKIRGLLYGGSVKPDNSKDLARVAGVSGFLVGGASLKSDVFRKIAESVL